MESNPFNPAFGRAPTVFIGREDIQYSFLQALSNINDPWRSTIITGIRGTGKTALLSQIQSQVPQGKIAVSVSPDQDFLNDILGSLYRQLPPDALSKLKKISGVTTPVFGLSFDQSDPDFTHTFRYQLTTLLDQLKPFGLGVVVFIDEVQKHTDQLRTFISTYQQLIREGYDISVLMAGLPHAISTVLRDDVITFFRRANQVRLGNLDTDLVEFDYNAIFSRQFADLNRDVIHQAACDTEGYPYLIQLIGYNLWENLAANSSGTLSESDVLERALLQSKNSLYKNVHELIFHETSAGDRAFLFAMAQDDGPSKVSDIQERLKKSKNYVNTYRIRLIEAEIIESSGHGLISFTVPYMRDYLHGQQNL
jgi:hypothetical protein